MTILEMLETYPKSAIVVKQWFLDKMLESLKDDSLPEDFKSYIREQGIDDDKVAGMVETSPRALFDVFDDHKLYINIDMTAGQWGWEVGSSIENAACSSRKEAERAAVEEAFKLLNEKL